MRKPPWHPVRHAVLLSPTALLTLACANSPPGGDAVEVRDSAGIRIVLNRAPASAEPWRIEPQPAVEIGGDENDTTQVLFQVAAAVVLADDRIVVAHSAAPMIRWFDAQGRYQYGTGRGGGGPGEFAGLGRPSITTMWRLPGDSVATWEHQPRRMQVFGPDGRFARAVVLDLPPDLPPRSYPQFTGPLDHGFVGSLTPPWEPGPVGQVRREPITYLRYRSDGTFAGQLARVPGFTFFTHELRLPDGSVQKVQGGPPLARVPAAWSAGDALFYGSGDTYELAVYDTAGARRTLVRKDVPVRPVTSAVIEAYKAETMARAPADPEGRRRWEESVNSAPYPSSLPAYRRIRADRAGMLWVQEYEVPGADSVTWSIFDRDGRWLADAVMPGGWRVLDIGVDHVLVLVRNELDVEIVRRHGLERR